MDEVMDVIRNFQQQLSDVVGVRYCAEYYWINKYSENNLIFQIQIESLP